MKFCLVDLKIGDRKANRDHTGGFGSFMHADGLMGSIVSRLKEKLIHIPVLSLCYGISILNRGGHEATYSYGKVGDADIIIIASSMHCYKEEVAFASHQKKNFPNRKVGFWGAFSKTNPELFRDVADFIIKGDLETTLIAYCKEPFDFSGDLDHGIVKNMDEIPPAQFPQKQIKKFSYFPLLHAKPVVTMLTSKGCSYDCEYCPYMVTQTKLYRRKNSSLVVDEIEHYLINYDIKRIMFRDIIFTLNRRHVEKICQEIIKRKIKIEWACETHPDHLPYDLIDLMYEAGFRGVNLGLETEDVEVIELNGRKPYKTKNQLEMVNYLHSKGIRVNGFYILGMLGDTPSSMRNTFLYASKLNTIGAQFCTMTPFPGTKTFERLKEDLIETDFTKFDIYSPVVDIKTSSVNEVVQASKKSYQYYIRKKWLANYFFSTVYRALMCVTR